MNESHAITKISELNVDGCGNTADNYIIFERALTWDEIKLLEQYLHDIKSNTSKDEYDTDTMVHDALDKFYKTTKIKYYTAPINEIVF